MKYVIYVEGAPDNSAIEKERFEKRVDYIKNQMDDFLDDGDKYVIVPTNGRSEVCALPWKNVL